MVLLASLLSFMVRLVEFETTQVRNFKYILTFFFYFHIGEGMSELSLADRATIANMSAEFGATMGFFLVDHVTLEYLKLTGRSDETVNNFFFSFFFFSIECKGV